MKRRQFVTLLAGAAAWPLAALAQQGKNIPTVGVLWHAGSAEEEEVYLSVLLKAFNDLGYVEGKEHSSRSSLSQRKAGSLPGIGARAG
jgi:putative tryptophan/tyrosine transport system substrate-binding protein